MRPEGNLKKNGEKIMSTLDNKNLDIKSVMLDLNSTPKIESRAILKEALELMDDNRLGIVCIVDKDGVLKGIITDGDIRRMLTRVQKPFAALMSDDVIDHSIKDPVTVKSDTSITKATSIMGNKRVWDLPVVSDDGILEGLLHLHPVIEAILGVKND